MANNKTTAEEMETLRQKRLSTLMASYEMYEASKNDEKKKHEEKSDSSDEGSSKMSKVHITPLFMAVLIVGVIIAIHVTSL